MLKPPQRVTSHSNVSKHVLRTGRRRKPGAGGCKHTVDVGDEGGKAGGAAFWAPRRRVKRISGEFNSEKGHFENISGHVPKNQKITNSVFAFMLNSKINFSVIFRLLILLSVDRALDMT